MNKIMALISSVAIVRLVDKKEYACLAYSDNLYSYITLLSGLGMANALLKYSSSKNEGKNKAYIIFSAKWGSVFQISLLFCVMICLPFICFPFEGVKHLVYIYMLYPLLEYWFNVIAVAVRSSLANRQYAVISFVQVCTVMCLGIAFTAAAGVKGVLFARYTAVIIAGGYGFVFLRHRYKNTERTQLSDLDKKMFLRMSVSLLAANLFSLIMPLNETALINNMIRDEIITANYKAATVIPAQLPFITNSVIVFVFPIIARMENRREIWKLSVKTGAGIAAMIFSAVITGVLCSRYLILFVYGKKYMDAVSMSRVFWIVYFFNAGFRILPMNILPALGVTKFNVIISAASCLFHYIIDYFFIRYRGIYGVAFAAGAVYLVSGTLYWFFLYKVCKREE